KAMLAAIGSTEQNYNPAPGSATRQAANAWLLSAGDPRVTRDPETQRVVRIVRQSGNVNSVWVDLIDTQLRYSMMTDNLGSITTTLSATYYTNYEYDTGDGTRREALGLQNWGTGIVPPIPDFKGSLRIGWMHNNHSANFNTNYTSSVEFDGSINNLFTGVPAPADGKVRSWQVSNVQYAYVLNRYFDSEITISAGIRNMFNQLPQRLPLVGGFESRLHSPWGRQFWASVNWSPN
ncbi:MAG: TonB-dependent receptor, partial [Gammaproteobacteria bacterium]|nr:TonB-dependent receptor [Gammaproteobacteria bacterium]